MIMTFIRQRRLHILLRTVLLVASCIAGALSVLRWNSVPLLLFFLCLLIFQLQRLLKVFDQHNRELIRFLEAIRYEDFLQSFPARPQLGGSSAALYDAFHQLFALFKQNRDQAERQYRYLQTIIEHIDIGLFSVAVDGRVDFINRAARNLLKIGSLGNIDDLSAHFNSDFVRLLREICHGQKQTVVVEGEKCRFSALVYASALRMGDQSLRLISLQNIDKVLEEKELQAWQSLIRVLTHEIMNSMTPIASLSDTAAGLMASLDLRDNEILTDVFDALRTIQNRSVGLMEFVSAYRNLTLIPKPSFSLVRVKDLLHRVVDLIQTRLEKDEIVLQIVVEPESLTVTADLSLMEQVLLNLLLNALDALKGVAAPRIDLSAALDDNGRTVIRVRDNGCGVAEAARDMIFIPFFSTKETGSGIGLAFSRQVMRLHQGYIDLAPENGRGSTFLLTF